MSDNRPRRHGLTLLLLAAAAAGPVSAIEGALFDPTRPSGIAVPSALDADGSEDQAEQLRLGGIFTGPDGTTALLNGRRVQAGDELGDLRVIAVEQDAVVVERGGSTQRIGIGLVPVKRPSGGGPTQ